LTCRLEFLRWIQAFITGVFMSRDYLPRKALQLSEHLAHVCRSLQQHPGGAGALGVSAELAQDLYTQVQVLDQVNKDYEKAAALAAAAAQSKWETYRRCSDLARTVAQVIQNHPATTNVDRELLGLTVPRQSRSRVQPPTRAPMFEINVSQRFQHELRVYDPDAPRGGRPPGVSGYEVWSKVVPQVGEDYSGLKLAGVFTGRRALIEYSLAQVGQWAVYQVRWINPRHQPGPFGTCLTATIAA
jgi:hypothetical protein